jgi:hypothetical protein
MCYFFRYDAFYFCKILPQKHFLKGLSVVSVFN